MVTKEELEKSTFVGRHVTVWFMFSWALLMFILDGIVYKVKAPPGESDWEYGPSVFLMCLVRARDVRCAMCDVRMVMPWRRERGRDARGREDEGKDGFGSDARARRLEDSRDSTNDSRGGIHPWARVWARERLTMVMTTRADRRFRVVGVFHS